MKLYWCPGDFVKRINPAPNKRSYVANRFVLEESLDPLSNCLYGKLNKAKKSLSNLLLLFERPGDSGYAEYSLWGPTAREPSRYASGPTGNCDTNFAHKNIANYLMTDGHVEALNWTRIPQFHLKYIHPDIR
jgi:prepilin-type processing-associated H-X9-DG protein